MIYNIFKKIKINSKTFSSNKKMYFLFNCKCNYKMYSLCIKHNKRKYSK